MRVAETPVLGLTACSVFATAKLCNIMVLKSKISQSGLAYSLMSRYTNIHAFIIVPFRAYIVFENCRFQFGLVSR